MRNEYKENKNKSWKRSMKKIRKMNFEVLYIIYIIPNK